LSVSDGESTSVDTVRVLVQPAGSPQTPAAPPTRPEPEVTHPVVVAADEESRPLPRIDARDMAVLTPELHGVSVERAEGAFDIELDAPAAALPAQALVQSVGFDPRDLQVERLEQDPSAPPPALPSLPALRALHSDAQSFESAFQFVPPDSAHAPSGQAGEPSADSARAESPSALLPEGKSDGLLAGLYGMLKSAVGAFHWPPTDGPSEPPPEKRRDDRKS